MKARFEFHGTGGELFKGLLKGWLLTGITFGIYMPWFVVSLIEMLVGRTTLRLGNEEVRLAYTGTGGELFKKFIVGYLLTGITFGIYLPWFAVDLMKFHQEHMTAVRDDGRTYRLQSSLTGGELFKTWFLGYLFTIWTLGIYMPWFLCKLWRVVLDNTSIADGDRTIATVSFKGQGGELFKTFIVGYLLTMVTFGIYGFWFQVKLLRFVARGTELDAGGQIYRGDFTGTGEESLKVNLVGYLLTMITFGIYGFWYMADLLRFQLGHTVFGLAGESPEGERVEPARRLSSATGSKAWTPVSAEPGGRAQWAIAFGIDEPANVQAAAIEAPRAVPALPEPAKVNGQPAADIHDTIFQSMHFPEIEDRTDRLSAKDPVS